jgi:hypothetical protein
MWYQRFALGAVLVLVLTAMAASVHAGRTDDPASSTARLVGTWKLVSARFGGQESDLPKQQKVLKHLTPVQMVWIRINPDTGQVTAMAGGSYSLKGDAYTETPEYGFGDDFQVVRGKTHSFTCKVEGDKWYHTGMLANGLKIEEVWQRVPPK